MAPPGVGTEVEGVHAVAAALAAGRVDRVLIDQERASALSDLIRDAEQSGAAVESVPDVRAVAVTSAPQGVVAVCRPKPLVGLAEAVGRSTPVALVVLDHLEDPRNVGAIARSALAAGFTGIVMSRRRAAPLGAAAFKAAAGALESLDLVEVSSIADAVADLRRLEVWSVGLDSGGDDEIFGLGVLSEPVAIVVGAEGAGLSRLVAQRCDVVAGIPIDSRVESLNAGVAAALAMFEVARVRSAIGD